MHRAAKKLLRRIGRWGPSARVGHIHTRASAAVLSARRTATPTRVLERDGSRCSYLQSRAWDRARLPLGQTRQAWRPGPMTPVCDWSSRSAGLLNSVRPRPVHFSGSYFGGKANQATNQPPLAAVRSWPFGRKVRFRTGKLWTPAASCASDSAPQRGTQAAPGSPFGPAAEPRGCGDRQPGPAARPAAPGTHLPRLYSAACAASARALLRQNVQEFLGVLAEVGRLQVRVPGLT